MPWEAESMIKEGFYPDKVRTTLPCGMFFIKQKIWGSTQISGVRFFSTELNPTDS